MRSIKSWMWGVIAGLIYSLLPFLLAILATGENAEIMWGWALMNMHVWLLFGDGMGMSTGLALVCITNAIIGALLFAAVSHVIRKK